MHSDRQALHSIPTVNFFTLPDFRNKFGVCQTRSRLQPQPRDSITLSSNTILGTSKSTGSSKGATSGVTNNSRHITEHTPSTCASHPVYEAASSSSIPALFTKHHIRYQTIDFIPSSDFCRTGHYLESPMYHEPSRPTSITKSVSRIHLQLQHRFSITFPSNSAPFWDQPVHRFITETSPRVAYNTSSTTAHASQPVCLPAVALYLHLPKHRQHRNIDNTLKAEHASCLSTIYHIPNDLPLQACAFCSVKFPIESFEDGKPSSSSHAHHVISRAPRRSSREGK